MKTLYPRCAVIDVPKSNVVVCVRCCDRPGKVFEESRTFSAMTGDLLALADWLAGHGVTHVDMESTGGYRKPVFHILEGGVSVILVNAEHIQKARGAHDGRQGLSVDRPTPERLTRQLVKRLEALGRNVTLEPGHVA